MGYPSGKQNRGRKYSKDAIDVGKCINGDALDRCTGGGNGYKVAGDNSCSAGKDVKITISCQGDSTKSSSCNVNSGNAKNTCYINKMH